MTYVNIFQISTGTFLILFILAIYKYVVYPAFLSPLSKLPNAHILSPITPLWILWQRFQNREFEAVSAAHRKYGSVVRLGPDDLSVNCIDNGIRTVYGGGFEKTQWYNFFINYGTRNTFSSLGSDHAIRRRRVSNVYAKSFLQNSTHINSITSTMLYTRLLPLLAHGTESVDILEMSTAYGLDFISAFLFGLSQSTNFIQEKGRRRHWLQQYLSHRSKYMFWLQELPNFTTWLSRFGIDIVPKSKVKASRYLEDWCLSLCDAADKVLQSKERVAPGNLPIVYQQLKTAMAKKIQPLNTTVLPGSYTSDQLEIASELLDHLGATRDIFGATITYIIFEISRNPYIQRRLREEFDTLSTPLIFPSSDPQLPGAKELEKLPLLNAVIKEGLRLRTLDPTGAPRLTPSNITTSLGPFTNIPPNVRVNAFPWSLHRNPDIFSDPEQWRPERWMNKEPLKEKTEKANEQEKWYWAFNSGPRMCLGSNMALQMMRYALTAIYTNFTTRIADDERTGPQGELFGSKGGFVKGDWDENLALKFEPL